MWNYNPVLLDTVSVVSNSAGLDGGGIYQGTTSLEIRRGSTVFHNSAEKNGGGIAVYVSSSSTNILSDSKLNYNTAKENGGAIYFNKGYLYCTGSEMQNNTADGNGGAIFADEKSKVDITQAAIISNIAYSGGAVAVEGSGRNY